MNTTEQYIFNQHMKNIDVRFEDFARECMAMQTVDGLSVILATDLHYIRKYALYVGAYYKLKEMVDFSGFIGADLLAITGDIVDGNTTIKRQYRDIFDVTALLKQSKTTSVMISKGNHDTCEWFAHREKLGEGNWLTDKDWYIHAINPLRVQYPMTLDSENVCGGYYYIDFPLQKIRVINLNTSDTENVLDENGILLKEYCSQWHLGMREKQLKWLTKALSFNEQGWSVVFMSHDFLCPFGDFAGRVSNGDIAWQIIQGFKNNSKGTLKSDLEYYNAEVEFDFTGNKSNDVLAYVFGHIHDDISFTKDGITAIASKNVLLGDKDWGQTTTQITGGWDFAVIDKKTRTFKSKRYNVPQAERTILLK